MDLNTARGLRALNTGGTTGADALASDIESSTEIGKGWRSAGLGGAANELWTQAAKAGLEGREADRQILEAQARDADQQAAQWAPRVQNVSDVRSLRDAADWAGGALGNVRTSVAPAVGGLVGGTVGLAAAPLTGGVINPVNAGFAGSALAGYGMEADEAIAGGMRDPVIRANKTYDDILNAGRVKGVVNAGLEALVPAAMGGKILGTGAKAVVGAGWKGAGKAVGKEMLKGGAEEFATEGTQSLTGQAAQNYLRDEPLSNLDYGQALNEAAAGAVAGHAMGAVGGAADVGHARLDAGIDKTKRVTSDPAGAIADGVADLGHAAGTLGAKALNWYERASSPPHRAFDALISAQPAADDVMDARAMEWAGHVLQTRDSSPEEIAAAKDFVLAQSKGDTNAWRTYRDKLTIDHHEGKNAAADQAIADELNGGKKSLMRGTLTDDFGEQEGRDPSADGVVDDYGTRVRGGMDGADAAAHAQLSQVGQPVLPRQNLATRGADLPALETAADIWRKQGVADKLLTATSDKTDAAQRQMAIGLLGWVARGFRNTDGEIFVPESLIKRYGAKAPKMIKSAAQLAFEQGLIGHDEAGMTPQIMQMAQLQHADATAVNDAVLGALPEYARSLYKPHIEDIKKLLRKVAAEGATQREEAALLDAFGSKEAIAQAMSKLPDPTSRYGGKVPGMDNAVTQVVRDADERVEGGVDYESGLEERAPETRVTYKGQGGKNTPFNTLHEHQQNNLATALSTMQNDPGVFARPVGVYDALKEQYDANHPYRRTAENEVLWNAVKKMTSTDEQRAQYLADIDKLSDAEREQQLKALNRSHKLLRVEQANEDVADQIRPDQVEAFREKRGERSPDVTAQRGMLYLERRELVDTESGETTGKNENFLTSTAKLLDHANKVDGRGSDGRTNGAAGKGAHGAYEQVLRSLAALIASDGTFTGRVGTRSAPGGEIQWHEQDSLPRDLKIAGTNNKPITVEHAQRTAATERRVEPERSRYAVKYAESLAAKKKELLRQANLSPKSERAREIAAAVRSGGTAIEAMYTKLRNQWDGSSEIVGDAIDSDRPSNRGDIVPSEHRGDEPIYRNDDGARVGLGTDAEGAGYEGHASRSEKAEHSADGPQPTQATPGRVSRTDAVTDARDWASDILSKKGVPAFVVAFDKLKAGKEKVVTAGLRALSTMTPTEFVSEIEHSMSIEDARRVLSRAALALPIIERKNNGALLAGEGDVAGNIPNGRSAGTNAPAESGRRDAVAERGSSQERGTGNPNGAAAAAELGVGRSPQEVARRVPARPVGRSEQGTQEGQGADGVERSPVATESPLTSTRDQLQAYLTKTTGKNALLASALRHEIERLDAGGKPNGNTTGVLAAAAKQFGALEEKPQAATSSAKHLGEIPMYYKMPVEAIRADLRDTYQKGSTTKQLMVDGHRTATTRKPFGEVGDTFTVDGRTYRITSIEPVDFSTEDGREKWSKREGWDATYVADHLSNQVYTGASQTVFESVSEDGRVILPSTSPFTAKDQAKSDKATKFIGRGSPKSSTAAYAQAWGALANSGSYDATDRVFVSVEGARAGRVSFDKAELNDALDAGATIIADDKANRERAYNVGERELATYLEERGYSEKNPGEWAPVTKADPTDRLLKTFSEPFAAAKTPREKINVLFNEVKGLLANHTEPGPFGYWRLTNTGDGALATAKYLDAMFSAELNLRDKMSVKQEAAIGEMLLKAYRAFQATYGKHVVDVLEGKQSRMAAAEPRTLFAPQWHEGFTNALDALRRAFEKGGKDAREAGNTPVAVGRTPVVLRAVMDDTGAKPFKRTEYLVGQGSTLYLKGLNLHGSSQHGDVVGYEVLRKLPALLANPVAVFKSSADSSDPNSFKVLVDARSDGGQPVVVALKPQVAMQQVGGERVNFVATVYPATWGQVRSWNDAGALRYYNEKSPLASKPGSNPQGAVGAGASNTREGFDGILGAQKAPVKVVTAAALEALPPQAWNAQTANDGTGKRASKEQVAAAKQHIIDTLGDSVELSFTKHFGDNSSGLWTPGAVKNTITLALNAADVVGTAFHESMHEFVSLLRKAGDESTQAVLKRVASNNLLLRKLEILLKDHPEAAAQLRADPDEAVAFMYQFWRAGLLKLGPETQTFFEKVKAFVAQVLGRVSREVRDAQQAEAIMTAFSTGLVKDDATRDAILQKLRESSEAHEAALERADKAGRDLVRAFGKLVFSSEAMMQATKNKYMRALAADFNQESGTAKGEKQALFDATKQQMNIWTNRLDNILNGSDEFGMKYSKDDLELARQALSSGKPAKDRVVKQIVARIEAFNEAMFKYVSERGVSRWDDEARAWVPVEHRKDYFRRVWNTDAVREGAAQFRELLIKHHSKELESIAREANGELARNETLDPGFASQIMKAKPAAEQTLVTPEHVADAIIARLLNANGQIELSESTSSLGMTPVATSVNRRSLSWIDAGKFDEFLSHDLVNIMSGYVASMVKRAEHTRVFGVGAEKLKAKVDKAVLHEMAGDTLVSAAEAALPDAIDAWRKAARAAHEAGVPFDEPFPTLRSVGQKEHFTKVGTDKGLQDLTQALKDLDQGMKAVMAMEGTLGADISPAHRSANSLLMTYQSLRVLPLVLFSSINDIMGIVAQDGGELKDAWHALVAGMREIRLRLKDEKSDTAASRRAEEWGTVDAGSFLDTLGQTYNSMYFTGKFKRLSDAFFKWNGMEAWNRATRITATSVAERAIKALKTDGVEASDKAAQARVEALFGKGFDVKNIKLDAEGRLDANDPANQAAMMRWVSNAIMSPNAAHRTIWGSDPRMAPFWMLKQFAYTFHRVMLKNTIAQAKLGNYRPAMVLALGYAPVAIAADAVKEMLVPGDEPPWMKMGLGAYLQHGIDRAGIFGVPGMIYDSVSYDYGVGLLGPTVGQLAHLPFDPVDESLVGALPAGGRLKKLVQD